MDDHQSGYVDDDEMLEVQADEALQARLRAGSDDARTNRGQFVDERGRFVEE